MKKLLKKTSKGIILSLAICFMIFVSEQITSYASNIDDYWFDIYRLFPVIVLEFIAGFLLLSGFLIILNKYKSKIYKKLYIALFILFLCLYVEGNFLVGFLPILNGVTIDWSKYILPTVISVLVWITIPVVSILLLKKNKYKAFTKYSNYVVIVILIMLAVSTLSLTFKKDFFMVKKNIITTSDNINDLSKNKNVLLFMLDGVDSTNFEKEMKRLNKEYVFKDFTYFKDTLASYGHTKFEIPMLLCGEKYLHQESFNDFSTKCIDNSKLINKLYENNYKINIYDDHLIYNGDNFKKVSNFKNTGTVNIKRYIKESGKIILFKYLPYPLKRFSRINTFNMGTTKLFEDGELVYKWHNKTNYDSIKKNIINEIDSDNFMLYHIEGGHPPYDMDVNLNTIDTATSKYEDKIDAAITIIEAYLDRIRNTKYYDNSAIVILADHGFAPSNRGKQNPILFIKGFNEKHEFVYSDKKVTHEDMMEAFIDLMDGKKSSELFKNTSDERLYYYYALECHIIEQTTKDHAWETDKLKGTGKKFDCE